MLLGRLLQLMSAVFQRALSQQIQRLTATLSSPVNALSAIDKTQHLYPFQFVDTGGIAANHLHRILLTLAHSCRCHLDTIHIQIAQQHARYYQLFVRQERHAAGLFAIAQRRVHYLNKGLYALVFVYLFACSHTSVFSLFCTRKSMSSSPCIRQCFLYPLMSKCSLRPVALLVTV